MIRFTHGDIFAQPAEAIVNPRQLRRRRRRRPRPPVQATPPRRLPRLPPRLRREGRLRAGPHVHVRHRRDRPRWIVHFPTKRHWRDRSAIGDVEAGLRGLAATLASHGIRSVAIPPLGCGLGGLDWRAVRPLVTACLGDIPITVIVLEPSPEAEPCAGAGRPLTGGERAHDPRHHEHLRPRRHAGARHRHRGRGGAHPAAHLPGALDDRSQPPRAALRLQVRLPRARHRRHEPAPPFPRWAEVIGARLAPYFDGAMPEQCIVNEYRPGQGIGMHADHQSFGDIVVSLSLADAWTMNFRPRSAPPLRPRRAGVRRGRPVASPLRTLVLRGPARSAFMHGIDPPPTPAAARRVSLRRSGRSPGDHRRRFRPCR